MLRITSGSKVIINVTCIVHSRPGAVVGGNVSRTGSREVISAPSKFYGYCERARIP